MGEPRSVRDDCRHYLQRSVGSGEVARRCRVGAAEAVPFRCPDGCLFFEDRLVSGAGWAQGPQERMSNTADGLVGLPEPRRAKPKPKKRR